MDKLPFKFFERQVLPPGTAIVMTAEAQREIINRFLFGVPLRQFDKQVVIIRGLATSPPPARS